MASLLLGLFYWLLLSHALALSLSNAQDLDLQDSDTLVYAPAGVFQGRVVGGVRAFLGVPYAQPPIGDRRFQDPEAVPVWSSARNATVSPPACLHFDFRKGEVVGEEDCLYLSIFSLEAYPEDHLLPVLVAFVNGDWVPPARGSVRLLRHGLVVVTVHFRMQVLGYLATESADAPGNVALADQLAALRWVRENIAAFGGDLNRVTALGQGDAATALALLLLSPAAQGLVSGAVIHGGCALTRLGLDPSPLDSTFKLAQTLECTPLFPFSSAQRVLQCFQTRSGAELAWEWHGSTHPLTRSMGPTLDVRAAPLLDLDPPEGPAIPLLVGVTPNDGLLRVYDYLSKIDFPPSPESPTHLLRALFGTVFSSPGTLDAISAYYLHAKKADTWTELVPILVQAVTEFSTYSSAAALARLTTKTAPAYLYELSFGHAESSSLTGSAGPQRPLPSDLLHLLLGVDPLDPALTLDDRVMSDIVVTLWAAFMKTGIPAMPVVPLPDWEPLPQFPGPDLPFYELSLDPKPRPSLRPHALAFWASMHALDTGQEAVEKDANSSYRIATWLLLALSLLLGSIGFCLLCPRLRDTTAVQRMLVYCCPHLLNAQQTEV